MCGKLCNWDWPDSLVADLSDTAARCEQRQLTSTALDKPDLGCAVWLGTPALEHNDDEKSKPFFRIHAEDELPLPRWAAGQRPVQTSCGPPGANIAESPPTAAATTMTPEVPQLRQPSAGGSPAPDLGLISRTCSSNNESACHVSRALNGSFGGPIEPVVSSPLTMMDLPPEPAQRLSSGPSPDASDVLFAYLSSSHSQLFSEIDLPPVSMEPSSGLLAASGLPLPLPLPLSQENRLLTAATTQAFGGSHSKQPDDSLELWLPEDDIDISRELSVLDTVPRICSDSVLYSPISRRLATDWHQHKPHHPTSDTRAGTEPQATDEAYDLTALINLQKAATHRTPSCVETLQQLRSRLDASKPENSDAVVAALLPRHRTIATEAEARKRKAIQLSLLASQAKDLFSKSPCTDAVCQVPSCGKGLMSESQYSRRYRLCRDCRGARSIVVDGKEQRFCQQCSFLHNVWDFDGSKKSCRKKLQEHAKRMRRVRASKASVAGGVSKKGAAGTARCSKQA